MIARIICAVIGHKWSKWKRKWDYCKRCDLC